jgi:CubicO group peptidase (beta-lactamase class C family)
MEVSRIAWPFTAAAVMQLVEAGKVGLDDPYVQHVPYFEMADPEYKEITLRHLLSHTAGMPGVHESDFYRMWEDPWTDDGAAERLVRSLKGVKLYVKPGSGLFVWSDIGYDILAALIQEVTGELFETYQQRHILKPLGMNASTFLMSEVKPEELVAAHVQGRQGDPIVLEHFPYARQHAPSACLFTTVVDLSHWIMAAMNGGAYRGKRILKPESQAWLWEPLIAIVPGYDFGYNSGWEIKDMARADGTPTRMIRTMGAAPGICTGAIVLPEEGLASIVFYNKLDSFTEEYLASSFAETLAKKMLRGEV